MTRQFLRLLIITALVFGFVYLLLPLMMPLFFGIILLPVLYPTYKFICKKKVAPWLSAIITINLFLGILFVPGVFVGIHGARITIVHLKELQRNEVTTETIVESQQENVEKLEELSKKVEDQFGFNIPPLEKLFVDNIKKVATFLLMSLSNIVKAVPDFLLGYILVLLTMFFGLLESDRLKKLIKANCLLSKDRDSQFLHVVSVSCRSVVISNVLTGLAQSLIVGLGAAITRSGDFFVVCFITFIFSFIPVIGAAPIAILLGAYQLTQSSYVPGIAMIAVGVIAGISDNLLRPLLLKGAVEIHPFLGLLTIIGGVITFGLAGLFIGPLILTTVLGLVPLYISEYKQHRQ